MRDTGFLIGFGCLTAVLGMVVSTEHAILGIAGCFGGCAAAALGYAGMLR
jgi:hypothetical protein